MADVDACKRHVAVFAFPYGSHARALLSLTEKLARAAPHVRFSFFTTGKSMESLFLASDDNINNKSSNIKPYVVWDGISDAGDDNGVARGHILERVNGFLRAGPHNLTEGLSRLPANERVTCVISDVFMTSALEVAQHLGVPWIPLWISHTCSLAAHFHTHSIRLNYSHHLNPNHSLPFIPGFSHMRFQDLPQDLLIPKDKEEEEESEFSKMLASMGEVLPHAKAVVINLYEELDPPSLVQHLRSKVESLIYVGFPSRSLPQSHTDTTGSLSWLDKQPPLSVAYIALGSIATPHPHELVVIAEALEETGVPFLWSLKDQLRACLPHGFLERSSMKGKIVPWAPQTLVLDHASVGVFVTHGGSNSINESVSSGVPMICRPYFGDQTMNARMVEAVWEIGVKIEDGVFTKEGLTRSNKGR